MFSAEKIFHKYDKNKDGMLSVDEFRYGILDFFPNFPQEYIEKHFKEIDLNGDGKINVNEFILWVETMLMRAWILCDIDGDGKITGKEFHFVMTRMGMICTEESCEKRVQAFDKDKDGYLNFEEFKALFSSYLKK